MLAVALEAEADAYVEALVGELDERGHRLCSDLKTPCCCRVHVAKAPHPRPPGAIQVLRTAGAVCSFKRNDRFLFHHLPCLLRDADRPLARR